MNINEFVTYFADQFDDTPKELFEPSTIFKELPEWSSLTALSVIAMIDEQFDVRITGADIRNTSSILDLFSLTLSKI